MIRCFCGHLVHFRQQNHYSQQILGKHKLSSETVSKDRAKKQKKTGSHKGLISVLIYAPLYDTYIFFGLFLTSIEKKKKRRRKEKPSFGPAGFSPETFGMAVLSLRALTIGQNWPARPVHLQREFHF